MPERIVAKFGGTSVADAAMVKQIQSIIGGHPGRRFVVVSAPGKRSKDDKKITDLLFLAHQLANNGFDFDDPYQVIADRFRELATQLGVPGTLDASLDELRAGLAAGKNADWVASRGEHLSAKVVAAAMHATFVETADILGIDSRGLPTQESYQRLAAAMSGDGLYIIPGYYGQGPDGEVKVFSRGGSDITGAVVARAIGASVYENWTDVAGFMMADPRIVSGAQPMREVTYAELRELSYMGANVLHEEAIFPVKDAGIPINIRSTHEPDAPGTMIVAERDAHGVPVVGIAGRKNFTVIYIYKHLMNKEVGFGRKVLELLLAHDISYEHTPTGIDSMSLVIDDDELGDKGEALRQDILERLKADECIVSADLALISTVGIGMAHQVGIAARCFTALAQAKVNVRMISQGVGELNIIVGVARDDFERAVKALYEAFVTA